MPEILTESFCERCGTRYTFESAAPKKTARLGKFKTTAKGLRNYVMSDDTSLDEAMAAARSDDEHEHTAQQLDAFHATFNFCMNCRQYTCGNCWNDAEGRCLTCAPHLGQEIMPAPFPEMRAPADIRLDAWPETDLAPGAEIVAAEAIAETVDAVPEVDAAERLDRLSTPTPAAEALPDAAPAAPSAEDAVPSWLAAAEAEALAAAEAQAAMEASTEAFEQVPAFDTAAIAEVVEEPAILEPEPVEPVGDLAVANAAAGETPELVVADATGLEPEPVAEVLPEAVSAAAVVAAEPAAAVEPAVAEPVAAEAGTQPVALEVEAEPAVAEAAEPVVAAEAEPIADDRAAAASRQTSAMLAKFRPGQSIDAELEAYEATMAAEQARADGVEPETIAAAAVVAAASDEPDRTEAAPAEEPAPPQEAEVDHDHHGIAAAAAVAGIAHVAGGAADLAGEAVGGITKRAEDGAPEPEHIAAAAAVAAKVVAEPEPVAAQAEPEPVAAEPEAVPAAAEAAAVTAETAPEPEADAAAAAARTDLVEQPTWRIVAPDAPAPVTNGHTPGPEPLPAAATAIPPTPAAPEAPPQWPATPQWPQPTVAHLAQRPSSSSPAIDALWAASARDVVSGAVDTGPVGGVQPCNNCGLSLSANARFCRRCGTRQGG